MKRFKNIYTIAFAMLALFGCEHDSDLENGEIDVPIQEKDYIFFDTEVNSRGALIYGEDFEYNFNVLGYKYPKGLQNGWYQVETQASQSNSTYKVFDNVPQTVTYNSDGTHTYTPAKEWEKKDYSFFAWYPDVDGTTLTWSGVTAEKTPFLTYKLDRTSTANHKDVMTACVIDHNSSISKSVFFTMQHRLSAIDIVARSYVNAAALGENIDATARIKIKSVTVDLKNLLYDTAKIPLNTENDERNTYTLKGSNTPETATTASYSILGTSTNDDVTLVYEGDEAATANLSLGTNSTMILIPQADYKNEEGAEIKGNLECTISIEYDIENEGGNSIWDTVYAGMNEEEIPSKTPSQLVKLNALNEGIRYEIELTFTKSGVAISVMEPDGWNKLDNIQHEFE